jgi:two-component sensor histidine kinase
MKQNKKLLQFVIHLMAWGLFFSLPFVSFWRNSNDDIALKVLHHGITLVSLLSIFYLNSSFLIERFLYHRQIWKFVAYNAIFIILIGYIVHLLKLNIPEMHNDFRMPPPPKDDFNPLAILFFKDIFPLIITMGLSLAIKVTAKWYELDLQSKEADRKHTEAELQNLRQQLNPHFLFNTLNNIYSLIAISPEKAQSVVLDLSKLLRYVLYENDAEKVALSREMNFIVNYVELMRIRLTSDVEVKMKVESVTESKLEIAPMLFITLVENAFKHGVSPNNRSFINIDIHMTDNKRLICTIKNSYFPKTETDRSGSGIGLENLRRRLGLLYPERYTFTNTIENDIYTSELSILL